jgi:hypothetical protein
MSTVDPDARGRRTGEALRFLFWPSIVIGTLIGPAIALIEGANHGKGFVDGFLVFIVVSVGLGLLAYYLPSHRSPLAIVAYTFAYIAGLFSVMGYPEAVITHDPSEARAILIFLGVLYAIALLFLILYVRRHLATIETKAHGVDTTATIMSAVLNGRVNYVAHYRITLKFEDNNGVTRYLRIGRTGGNPQPGQTLPLRYDPDHPGSKNRIVVGY